MPMAMKTDATRRAPLLPFELPCMTVVEPMSSFIERDFLMRAIKQMVELLARALKLGSQKKDEAMQLLEAGTHTLLGMDFRTLSLVDSNSAADLLGSVPRILIFAKLLEAMRQVAAAAGDEGLARSKAQHSAEMALEVLSRSPKSPEALELLRTLAPAIDASLLPERLRALVPA